MKDQPLKLALVAGGVIAGLGAIAYDRFAKPVAPTGGIEDISGYIMQIASLVSFVMAAFSELKKAIPPEAIAAIREMLKDGKVNISEVLSIYPMLDFNAIMEIVKKYVIGKDKTIKIEGDEIKVEPKKPDGPAPPPAPSPASTDDDLVRSILNGATRISKPVKLNLQVGGKPAITLDIAEVTA